VLWSVEDAIKAFRSGIPVLIFDDWGREAEVDYVVHPRFVDADRVFEMRRVAGGLICFAMCWDCARLLGIDFAYRYLEHDPNLVKLVKKPSYGDYPAFSIWVNHVGVRTGISDEDRALTIRALGEVVELFWRGRWWDARVKFLEEFYSPGHVPILISRGLARRLGHTEHSVALAQLSGLSPAAVIVEMLSRGRSASLEEAYRVSREAGWPLIISRQVRDAWVQRVGEDMHCRYHLR